MLEQPDSFSSQRVEESIEELSANNLPPDAFGEQGRLNPDARLVHDMQALYTFERKRYLRALQRVEDRLVEQYVTNSERPAPLPVLPGQQARTPRTIQQGRLCAMEQKKSRMASFGRRVSLLVAVLVMGVLVGSLLLVMSAAHQKTAQRPQHNTQVGLAQTPTSTAQTQSGTFGQTVYITSSTPYGFTELVWSPDNRRIASISSVGVTIWDATTGQHLVKLGVNAFSTLAWSPDSQLVVIGTSTGILMVNGQTGAVVHTHPISTVADILPSAGSNSALSARIPTSGGEGVHGLAWSHDGNFLAVAISYGLTGRILVLNPQTFAEDYALPLTTGYVPDTLAWSADGKYIAARVFNPELGNVAVPSDQLMTLSGGLAMKVWVWSIATKQVVLQHSGSDNRDSMAWSPNSDTLAFCAPENGTANLHLTFWDAATNQVTFYQDNAFGPLAWSPDGKYIVFAGSNGPITSSSFSPVSVIDASTGKLVYEYKQMSIQVATLAWSPDGKYIATGEGDTNTNAIAKVWTAE